MPRGGNWQAGGFSGLPGAPAAASNPIGYYTSANSQANVIYRGSDGHVASLFSVFNSPNTQTWQWKYLNR
jgi:hypothetical protein